MDVSMSHQVRLQSGQLLLVPGDVPREISATGLDGDGTVAYITFEFEPYHHAANCSDGGFGSKAPAAECGQGGPPGECAAHGDRRDEGGCRDRIPGVQVVTEAGNGPSTDAERASTPEPQPASITSRLSSLSTLASR